MSDSHELLNNLSKKRANSRAGSFLINKTFDFSILNKLMHKISLQEWRQSTLNLVQFRKSRMIDDLDLEDSLLDTVRKMKDGLVLLTLVSPDKTRVNGCI